jgi:nicotinate-nucleotide adenylyltransferase
MQSLAILGGTFNPVHLGHLLMAEAALSQFPVDQVIWVPTRYPPYKSQLGLIEFEHRLELIRRAIAPNPAFRLFTVEQTIVERTRSSPSYAIDALIGLQKEYSHSRWFWIIGLDAFRSLPKWQGRQSLIPQCQWLVAPRLQRSAISNSGMADAAEPFTVEMQHQCEAVAEQLAQQSIELRWELLPMPLVDVSSSLIRQYCRDRRSIRYLVPDAVRDYILAHQLYVDDENLDVDDANANRNIYQ